VSFPIFKNIDEFPLSLRPLLTEFAGKLLGHLHEECLAVLVYGSAAGIDYNPGISNINIAVVVKKLDFSLLKENLALVKWGHKHKIVTPLFLTRDYILSALDVFPVEFSEIKQQHKVIWGEDIFKDLEIPVKDLRLLCEQQVKGKLLRLRQAYLEVGSKPFILKNLLGGALSDLIPVFRQLIILKGQKAPSHKEELLKTLAVIFSLDLQSLLAALHDKNKKTLIPSHLVEGHLQNFIAQLEILSRHLDSL